MAEDSIAMQDIFVFERSGIDENGKVRGAFRATRASAYRGCSFAAGSVPIQVGSVSAPMSPTLLALMVFIVVGGIAFGVMWLVNQRSAQARLIKERLASERKGPKRSPEDELALPARRTTQRNPRD